MAAIIKQVVAVRDHPTKSHLSLIILFGDIQVVSMKLDDGTPRYAANDLVLYIEDGSIVPDYLLRDGFWNDEKNQGGLAGPTGNRVKASNFGRDLNDVGVRSAGILIGKIKQKDGIDYLENDLVEEGSGTGQHEAIAVEPEMIVSAFLRVTEA